MTAIIEGANILKDYRGVRANVLVYQERCDACGYLAPNNSVVVTIFPNPPDEPEGFTCPSCANPQAVRVYGEKI